MYLRHDSGISGEYEHASVGNEGPRDHVLDEVDVPGTVDVRVMAISRLVFHVTSVDGDSTTSFVGTIVDFLVWSKGGESRGGQDCTYKVLMTMKSTHRALGHSLLHSLNRYTPHCSLRSRAPLGSLTHSPRSSWERGSCL